MRPRHYDSEEELIAEIEKYFSDNQRVTITGLALSLGFESRQSIYDYEKDGRFSYIIKNARLRVEACYEGRLIYDNQPTGVIFALKNMGWKDRQEIDSTNTHSITWQEEKNYEADSKTD
jgi:hypothetical protein